MRLDGDHPGPPFEQGGADRTLAGADVEYEAARFDGSVSDETLRPAGVELVPSPSA
jgi:hypothetical protein